MWRPEFEQVGAPWWDDQPVIIVGTGPSLKHFDFSQLQGLGHVLAVKQAWKDLPFAEACVGIDIPWLTWARCELLELASRIDVYAGVPDQEIIHDPLPGVHYLRRIRVADSLSEDPETIECAGNSGFAALNLAFLKRARRIYLFGFDFHGVHYNADHYSPRNRPVSANSDYLLRWAESFRAAVRQLNKRGIEVICASPGSKIDAFPRVTHEQAVADLHRLRSERVGCVSGGEEFGAEVPVGSDPSVLAGASLAPAEGPVHETDESSGE